MSVPKSKRAESTLEYIATATKLAAKVFRFSNSLPKRFTFKIGNPLFEDARMVVFHVKAANLVYVNNDVTFDQRRGHLNEATAHLLMLETDLTILHETTHQIHAEQQSRLERGETVSDPKVKAPNDNVYREFAELIEKERSLISGVKRRDTQAYNKHRQEAGAHPDC